MSNTKCGCPNCRNEKIPTTRNGWKSRNNSHGRIYGSFRKPNAQHRGRRGRV